MTHRRRWQIAVAAAAAAALTIVGVISFARAAIAPPPVSQLRLSHPGGPPASSPATSASALELTTATPSTSAAATAIGSTPQPTPSTAAPFTPAVGRVPSSSPFFGYDSANGYPLLLTAETDGGASSPGQTYTNTTWKWDGTHWVTIAEDHNPIGDSPPVYDPAMGKTLALGGCSMGCPQETWAWDGQQWSNLNTPTTPQVGSPELLAFDPVRRVMVLHSVEWATRRSSTWLFDGHDWTRSSPRLDPPPRTDTQMVYDVATSQMILYGGSDRFNNQPLDDTWTWDGASWIERHPSTKPPPGRAQLAYDPKTRRVVLLVEQLHAAFQMGVPSSFDISSWSWDGGNWSSIPGNLPAAGWNAALTYDVAHDQLVLFEGTANQMSRASQTWVYAGGAWVQRS